MNYFSEDHKEIQSGKKLDDEGYMAQVEMEKIEQSLEKLRKVIKSSNQQLPAWVQSKITKSSDYLDIVADYLASDVKMNENISYNINPDEHKKTAKKTRQVKKIEKAPTSSQQSLPNVEKLGPRLPKFEETSLVNKILSEMMGDKPGCDTKKAKPLEKIAKKHKVSIDSLKKELKKGMKVEMEHTTDKGEAETIALHHLEELPDYYTRLIKMEGEAEIKEESKSGDSNLRDWFSKSSGTDPKTGRKVAGWVQIGGPFAGAPCARQSGQKSTPKCGSSKMAANLSDNEEEKAFNRKNRKDPNQPEKTGAAKPTYVKTEEVEIKEEKKKDKKDACYHKVKSRYDVWPSAYASGALVKCRKVGASNWGDSVDEAVRLPMQTGQLLRVLVNWRGKHLSVQMFFPQLGTPKRDEITYAVNKIYPEARVISYVPCQVDGSLPLIQLQNSKSKNYLLSNNTIGEEKENKPLNEPMRTPGERKKFKVYVKDPQTGNIVTVRFGDPNLEIKRDDPERRKNFRARHNCSDAKDKTTPKYWSCYQWRAGKKVED
jgi:hypothetical protein